MRKVIGSTDDDGLRDFLKEWSVGMLTYASYTNSNRSE